MFLQSILLKFLNINKPNNLLIFNLMFYLGCFRIKIKILLLYFSCFAEK